jgi:UDP-glucuronate 4-epimerase
MRILVTGGAGFIGSRFSVSCLMAGHEVSILDDFNDFYDPAIKRDNVRQMGGSVEVFETDLRDQGAVERAIAPGRFDAVVHLAARAGVRPSIQDPGLYIETNVAGTFHVLDAVRKAGIGRVVAASSSSVYGVIKEVPFHERMCLNQTISPYAATKLATEQLCSNYSHLYGIRTVALRFFTVYGPAQRPDLAIHKFTAAISRGHPIDQYGDGSTRRDYTYIDDIVQGMMACLTFEGPLCEVFNLGESETTTLSDLIAAIEAALGKKAVINRLPEQPGDVPLTYADITKASDVLGYRPATKIADGIPRFVEWYLSRNQQTAT